MSHFSTPNLPHPARVAVVGSSCAGKSTFCRGLSARLAIPHVELDELYWQPQWTPTPRHEFRLRVESATDGVEWIVDGNYSGVRDIVWERANCIVWLNLSFPVVLWRSVARTFKRTVTGERLFGDNRESLLNALSPDWIPWWVLRTFHARRREYRREFAARSHSCLVIELRSALQAHGFLESCGN